MPAFFHKLRQLLVITITWIIANWVVELYNSINYDRPTGTYFYYFLFGKNGFHHLLITSIGPITGGLLFGSFIVFYQRDKLKGKTYGHKLIVHSLLYIFFVCICIGLAGVLGAASNRSAGSFWQKFFNDVYSLRVIRLVVTWYFIVLLTIFLLDVSEKYGSGTLRKLMLGKYHTPGREERIFMFLDLKSSTTIAEKIGDEKYFKMLRFFYKVANEAVINSYGEIYQYVGDEIVISWKKEQGIKEDHCLQCFYDIEKAVQDNADKFEKEYAVIPGFKAGVHVGTVMTGEIGTVKKDIVYSGDVLNTTARIVALCNQYGEKLIVSSLLYTELNPSKKFLFSYLDSPQLKGKALPMKLFTVKPIVPV